MTFLKSIRLSGGELIESQSREADRPKVHRVYFDFRCGMTFSTPRRDFRRISGLLKAWFPPETRRCDARKTTVLDLLLPLDNYRDYCRESCGLE